MIPNTGAYAKFTFINKMDALNGIYQLIGIESFDDALNKGVDFYTLLYTPAGLTKTDWTTDYASYIGDDVYWLQPTDSSKASIPVPSGVLSQLPDISVGKYFNFNLVVNIGTYPSPDSLSYLATEINDMVSATTGEASNVYWTASGSTPIYMTKGEYNTLDAKRQANAKILTPLITRVNLQNKEIDDLKARNNYLEQALIEAISKQTS